MGASVVSCCWLLFVDLLNAKSMLNTSDKEEQHINTYFLSIPKNMLITTSDKEQHINTDIAYITIQIEKKN
jgi:hypothetical protein